MKLMQSLLGGAVFIALGFAFAVVCKAQYPPPTTVPPKVVASPSRLVPQAVPSKEGDLDGKVLFIVPKNKGLDNISCPYSIENVKSHHLGCRLFFVGTVIDAYGTKSAPRTVGSTVWVALEGIEAIYQFKNIEDLRKHCPPNVFEAMQHAAPPPAPGVDESKIRESN